MSTRVIQREELLEMEHLFRINLELVGDLKPLKPTVFTKTNWF
jgi:hypothetical protein